MASDFLMGKHLPELLECALNSSKIQSVQALNQLEMAVTLDVGKEAELDRTGRSAFSKLRHFLCGAGAGPGVQTLLGSKPRKTNEGPHIVFL